MKITVSPIKRGFRFGASLRFTGPNGAALSGFDLTTADRIKAQFRRAMDEASTVPALATIDTNDGSIDVVNATTLSFTLTAEQTAAFPAAAWVDFIRLDGNVWTPIPVAIQWPVQGVVTRP